MDGMDGRVMYGWIKHSQCVSRKMVNIYFLQSHNEVLEARGVDVQMGGRDDGHMGEMSG